MKRVTLITVIICMLTLTFTSCKATKSTKGTEYAMSHEDRQKAKAIANVKRWKSEAGHTVICSQVAPNK